MHFLTLDTLLLYKQNTLEIGVPGNILELQTPGSNFRF